MNEKHPPFILFSHCTLIAKGCLFGSVQRSGIRDPLTNLVQFVHDTKMSLEKLTACNKLDEGQGS